MKRMKRQTAGILLIAVMLINVISSFGITSSAGNVAIPGDINADGYVNGRDIVSLLKHLAEWNVIIDENNSDVNADGNINGRDAVLLIKYLAEWDVELLPQTAFSPQFRKREESNAVYPSKESEIEFFVFGLEKRDSIGKVKASDGRNLYILYYEVYNKGDKDFYVEDKKLIIDNAALYHTVLNPIKEGFLPSGKYVAAGKCLRFYTVFEANEWQILNISYENNGNPIYSEELTYEASVFTRVGGDALIYPLGEGIGENGGGEASENNQTFGLLDKVRLKSGVNTFVSGTRMATWLTNATLYIRQINNDGTVIISTQSEGAVTGTVWASDLILVSKAEKQEYGEIYPVSGTVSTGSTDDELSFWNFLVSRIGNKFAVAGILGNIYYESSLRSDNLQNSFESSLGYSDSEYTIAVDNGSYDNFVYDSAGYGICQWTFFTRKEALLKYARKNEKSIGDWHIQLEFLVSELESKNELLTLLNNSQSVLEASNLFLFNFENPYDQSEAVQMKRAEKAQYYYDKYSNQ